jgi:hypothetical protein
MTDIQAEVEQLAVALTKLSSRTQEAWHSWFSVARQLEGSVESATYLSGLAALPEWQHLFVLRHNRVRLTQEGMAFAREATQNGPTLGPVADAVAWYARRLKPIVLDIESVSLVATVANRSVHAIGVEIGDEILPTETPVEVKCRSSSPVYGRLVGQESDNDLVYVACTTDILPAQEPYQLVIDRAYLLTLLASQLRALAQAPELFNALVRDSNAVPIADANSAVVAEQLAALPAPWARLLWGPPGAGKTYGLAHLAVGLLKAHPAESILIVAPSNRAVDGAMIHIRNRLTLNGLGGLINSRRVLRFGYPRSRELIGIPELLGPVELDDLNRQVQARSREIAAAEKAMENAPMLAMLRAKLLATQEAVKAAVQEHVARCSLVATTTTLAYMPTSPVAARTWDTVIVDEATMVPPAMCLYLASRARRRLLLAGDPCQLGPVYEAGPGDSANATLWLRDNIFVLTGISQGPLDAATIRLEDGRLARIASQRRCGEAIWELVQHLYPAVANDANQERARNIAKLPPEAGCSIAMLDTRDEQATCEQARRSWQNTRTAELAVQTAQTIASESSVEQRIAIISPYRAQVKLLRELLRTDRPDNPSPTQRSLIEAGTVHQFQGSEADVVIFDLVDGPGRSHLGILLRGDTGTRLLNVAITRARGKFVLIADSEWCERAHVAVSSPLLGRFLASRTPQ